MPDTQMNANLFAACNVSHSVSVTIAKYLPKGVARVKFTLNQEDGCFETMKTQWYCTTMAVWYTGDSEQMHRKETRVIYGHQLPQWLKKFITMYTTYLILQGL